MTEVTLEAFKKHFGRRIALLRKERGMTQEQLARAMKMDPVSIAYLEGAKRGPSFVTIYKLSKALNISASEFFG